MQLTGDADGIAVLHEMKTGNREYLKFLIQEARTVFERAVDFKGRDGAAFRLTFEPKDGSFSVSRRA